MEMTHLPTTPTNVPSMPQRRGTRRARRLGLFLAAVSVVLLALSGMAFGGGPTTQTVTVTKVVTGGTPPAGAAYTVTVNCAQTSGGAITDTGSANFTGPGGPTTVISSINSGNHPFCNVLENPNGGAASVTFRCIPQNGSFAGTNICDANGNFDSLNPGNQTIAVTVTNTFPADPAAPVVVSPRFTG
jgi:hypothetical protein